jgi:outer membrane protein TolC
MIFFFFVLTGLNAITLEQAIKTAIKHNPSINKSSIDIDIRKKLTKQAEAVRFGQFDALASYDKYDSERTMQPFNIKYLSENIFSVGAQYNLPIFTGFELTENIKISKLNEKITYFSNKLNKNQIIFNIKSVYYKILSLKKQLKTMYNYKDSLKELLKNVDLMVATGKKPEVDLYKIEYDVKNADAAIAQLQNNINTLKYALKEIMGKKDFKIGNIEDINLTKNFSPEKIGSKNLTSIKRVNAKSSIASSNIKKAKSEYFPKLYLNANIFENYDDNGNDINIWQVTLNMKFDIFDFGKRKNSVEEKKLEKLKIDFEKLEIELKKDKDTADAINKVKTEEANIEAFKNQIKFAKESERIEKMKYEEGVSRIYDYLYAKARRYIAESKYYDALYNRENAIAYYYYVTEKFAK